MSKSTDEIKKIIAVFLKTNPENINRQTIIDNSVVQGSVKIHIMYGDLADNGYRVKDYVKIKTFGELLSNLGIADEPKIKSNEDKSSSKDKGSKISVKHTNLFSNKLESNVLDIGVDIVKINKLPRVPDFRESNFYTDNFSLKEIAYCVLKPDPYKSFAGKFAAKEAVVKANNDFKNINFNEIEILNNETGKPTFHNFSISISYEDNYAIAIASLFIPQIINDKADYQGHENENLSKIKKQIIDKINNDIGINYLNKKYRKMINVLIFLNILIVIYIAYKISFLF